MGSWFAKFLKSNGYRVIISDRNRQAGRTCSRRIGVEFVYDYILAVRKANIILLATPTYASSLILKRLGRELRKGTLVIEISSMKEPVRRAVSALHKKGIAVLSIHPMFGPGTKTLKGRSVLVVSRTRHYEAKQLLSTLQRMGARLVPCTIGKHDKLASVVLALPHFMNLSLIETLRSLRISLNDVGRASGTTFRLQSLIAETIYQEDHANEVSILTDCRPLVLQTYNQTVSMMLNTIMTKPERISSILSAGRRFVKEDRHFVDAYGRFNAAVQAALV